MEQNTQQRRLWSVDEILKQARMEEHFSFKTATFVTLPQGLQSVVKTGGKTTQWETWPCPNL